MKISILGAGLMGRAAASRLIELGHDVTLWNRTPEKVEELLQQGATCADSPAAALATTEYALTFLSDAGALAQVFDSTGELPAGRTVIQMGTIAPLESQALALRVRESGARYLEAPVLGSLPEARSGTLIIMAGADGDDYAHALPVLGALSQAPRHIGPVGQGAALKLAYNQLIASLTTAFATSLAYTRAHDIDTDTFMELLRSSALYAPTFDKKLNRMLEHDYANPNFPLRHLVKDADLFTSDAQGLGIDNAMLTGLRQTLQRAMDAGHGGDDYCSLFEAVARPG